MLVAEREFILVDGANQVVHRSENEGECISLSVEYVEGFQGPYIKPLRVYPVSIGYTPQIRVKQKKTPQFAERLKTLREGRQLTRLEVATELGIHEQTLYKYEAGKVPSPNYRRMLANYFGIKIIDLFKE